MVNFALKSLPDKELNNLMRKYRLPVAEITVSETENIDFPKWKYRFPFLNFRK